MMTMTYSPQARPLGKGSPKMRLVPTLTTPLSNNKIAIQNILFSFTITLASL